MVWYWDCWIQIYKTGNTRTPTRVLETAKGEGRVQKGTSLLFGGGGKVKQEKDGE